MVGKGPSQVGRGRPLGCNAIIDLALILSKSTAVKVGILKEHPKYGFDWQVQNEMGKKWNT